MDDPRFPGVEWSIVEERLGEGLGTRYPLSDGARPEVYYDVEHGGSGITLLVGLERTQQPPRSPLASVHVDVVSHEGRRMARIRTSRTELLRDFHDFLMAVAERIVVKGHTLEKAFVLTVQAWSSLLDRPHPMGTKQKIGLHGELAVLRHLANSDGWPTAVSAWVGPLREEHDFALTSYDLEVKTTASERRFHTVHGTGQLQESPDRPLWFVSLQLTRSGNAGRTLRESVTAVRDAVATDTRTLRKLDDALTALGWSADQPDDEHWVLRNAPLVLSVTTMPVLTHSMLPNARSGHITSVIYDIDVTGAATTDGCPFDLSELHLP
jgi:hypothetical protein